MDFQDVLKDVPFQEYFLPVGVPLLLVAAVGLLRRSSSRPPYPPGPKAKPLVGNFFDFPAKRSWETYTEWGKQYGDVVHIEMLGKHFLVLNSVKATSDLLEKRSTVYSDRPWMATIPLMGWDFSFSFMSYTDTWQKQKKLFHQSFRKEAIAAYHPILLRKVQDMLRSLLASPADYEEHVKVLTSAIIMAMIYGYDVKSMKDRFVDLQQEAMRRLSESAVPGRFMVNIFPFLRHVPAWFPGAGFQNYFRDTRRLLLEMKEEPFQYVKQNMQNGTERQSIVRELVEENNAEGGSKEQEIMIRDVTGVAYAAAVESTNATILVFMLAMAQNPRIMRKAQAELDAVVGLGTIVLPNIWGMVNDESKYPDPGTFYPERYMTADGKINSDDHIIGFGFGRRLCAGRDPADATVWATIVTMLAVLDITPAKDAAGNEIKLDPGPNGFTDGMVSQPKPFKCNITARNEITRQLIVNVL
ncbi:O-methylsterigmatocystin oxidoreductase [Mycena sanguinolenta]|uniref:O-methylsterigmatocystin oxidoreductase n=1 Tax=Mycena sanguinolenta TaxID=230812 RepID=A0A8H6XUB5_9AGAR|nr:O-methylsterigmatocystin oxidoreductase [Mycena sanguinolenta]